MIIFPKALWTLTVRKYCVYKNGIHCVKKNGPHQKVILLLEHLFKSTGDNLKLLSAAKSVILQLENRLRENFFVIKHIHFKQQYFIQILKYIIL